MSLSLALGILVCNMSEYGFLTSAYACGGAPATVFGESLKLDNALAPNGVAVHNIVVNGELVETGVIAGSVRFVDSDVVNANGVIVGNETPTGPDGVIVGNETPTGPNGVIVGNEAPCLAGVIVGNETPTGPNGVIVGNETPTGPSGVIVGNEIKVAGLIISSTGTANGGTLTGDNLNVTNGVITGQNLLLSGTTIEGGFISISGTITAIQITPAN